MTTYLSPGVYVEEISTLPPAVAEVATAVPAFVGFTELASGPRRVSSLLEYQHAFGETVTTFEVTVADTDGRIEVAGAADGASMPPSLLPYAVRHYFANGGGPCWVVSAGTHSHGDGAGDKDALSAALQSLRALDEPTLVAIPASVHLSPEDHHALCAEVIDLCASMKDRFAVLDVLDGDVSATSGQRGEAFRNKVSAQQLAYGAAYLPNLVTSFTHLFDEARVTVKGALSKGSKQGVTLASLSVDNPGLQAAVRRVLSSHRVVLPPSAAVAGVFASVDRDRGVWKAPANVPVAAVIGPTVNLTDRDQDGLNVDATSGKSLNAIRAFTGRGTLVWGARTLAGNSSEWRYVSVRRLFVTLEESIQKASAFAVFEPNDATTWLKVKGMIDSYLHGLWQQGAFAGSTRDEAFFVQVGLGRTMTEADVEAGLLKISVGIAAVRPAEFVVLQFSHLVEQT